MLSEPLLAAYCVFGSVSLTLYVCVIRAILTSPLRKNSVYKLMVALGTVDISGYCLNAFLFRFSMCPRFFDFFASIGSPFWLRMPLFLTYTVGYAQYLLHFAICVNRLTAVLMLTGYTSLWSKLFAFLIPTVFFLATIPSFHFFFSDVAFRPLLPSDPSLGYAVIPVQYALKMNDTVFMMHIVPIFAVSCLTVNATTLALIIRVKRNSAGNIGQRPEVNLFIIACVMVMMQCFNGSFHFVAYYIHAKGFVEYIPALVWHFQWINDVNNFSAPWVTIIASRSLRDAAFGRKQKAVSPLVFTSPLVSPVAGTFPAFQAGTTMPVVS